jgi:glycosyltransferase involved in cell wall biosynthesis
VEVVRFYKSPKKDYFLFLSRLVPYKRGDLAIKAFKNLKERLIVAGDGPEYKRLKRIATKNIEFTGYLSDEEVARFISEARALIYPSEEDFGITMVEALASGTPVIAFRRGGAPDIIQDIKESDRPTGILFEDQSEDSIRQAIQIFIEKEDRFNPEVLIESSKRFSSDRFKREIKDFLDRVL